MLLFFDTETTGLPRNWNAPVSNTNNWPRMVQLAWLSYDLEGNLLGQGNHIIKPEGYVIPADVSRIHGITTQRALDEGEELEPILVNFASHIQGASHLLAHNISFDEKVIGAEFVRKKIQSALFSTNRICTMKSSAEFCAIPGKYGDKWPKLSELHRKVFGVDFEQAHDASADILATARCFWELRRRKVLFTNI